MSEYLPAANLILGLIAFVYLLFRTSIRNGELPDEVSLLHKLSLILLFGLLVVSARQLKEGQASLDVVVITIVKLSTLTILWRTRKTLYRTGTRSPGDGDSDDKNRDIQA